MEVLACGSSTVELVNRSSPPVAANPPGGPAAARGFPLLDDDRPRARADRRPLLAGRRGDPRPTDPHRGRHPVPHGRGPRRQLARVPPTRPKLRSIGRRVEVRITLTDVVATCAGVEVARPRPMPRLPPDPDLARARPDAARQPVSLGRGRTRRHRPSRWCAARSSRQAQSLAPMQARTASRVVATACLVGVQVSERGERTLRSPRCRDVRAALGRVG